MNISTYEARIKALEDQLNPPAPGGSTGLLSVVVTPDITLSDGTSLNAKMAELMPVGFGDDKVLDLAPLEGALTEGNEYSITITPDSESYVAHVADGEKGAPVTISRTVTKSGSSLTFGVIAEVVKNPEEMQPSVENRAMLRVKVTKN